MSPEDPITDALQRLEEQIGEQCLEMALMQGEIEASRIVIALLAAAFVVAVLL